MFRPSSFLIVTILLISFNRFVFANATLSATELPSFSFDFCKIDPAVTIHFKLLKRVAPFRGDVQIIANIQNLGTQTFVAGSYEASVFLYEDQQIVGSRVFKTLVPGQQVQLRFTREWDAANYVEGEFPPIYRAVIIYDPNICRDNNPYNDDCNATNNSAIKRGTEINALFY
ncbi:MAG: hypothetical protein HQK50_19560 [Oligoflexia bacterium]|nr:hypothetical protein [Oligoflexia bacterium]MBF0367774.1 hypothetical protein [Oligoflexia bacterium]